MCNTISIEFICHLHAKFKTLYCILIWFILQRTKFIKVLSNDSTYHLTADNPDPILVYSEFQDGSRPYKFKEYLTTP